MADHEPSRRLTVGEQEVHDFITEMWSWTQCVKCATKDKPMAMLETGGEANRQLYHLGGTHEAAMSTPLWLVCPNCGYIEYLMWQRVHYWVTEKAHGQT